MKNNLVVIRVENGFVINEVNSDKTYIAKSYYDVSDVIKDHFRKEDTEC
jgi:hypothetical protein